MNSMSVEKTRQTELWICILLALNAAMPIGTTDKIIHIAIKPIVPGVTELEIRKQIDYLTERKFIITEKYQHVWFSKVNIPAFIDGTITYGDRAWIDSYEMAMTPEERDRWAFEKEMRATAQVPREL
ncbi:MAG: hypothetical protein ABFD76_08995 [Smithella sp.]